MAAQQRRAMIAAISTTGSRATTCLRAALAIACCTGCVAAHAARPMITDDARTVDAGACQLEAYRKNNHGSHELVALPACNFFADTELTVGAARNVEDFKSGRSGIVAQVKKVFNPITPTELGTALSFGAIFNRNDVAGERVRQQYVNLPVSIPLRTDSMLHINIGILRDRELRETRSTWGLALEKELTERLTVIAEAFGDSRVKPLAQTGLRIWIEPNRFQVDATVGAQRGDGRWVSLGIRLLAPKLFD
jgi:hypothetical protein